MIGRKNRNGLTVDDLRSMVADAEKIGAYVRLKAKTKMNGTLIELTIDEPEVEPPADPWTPPFDVNPRFSPPTERPSD
jgi:hypothetical protein